MQIKFDSHQDYQLDAIRSVVDLFEGQPLAQGPFEIQMHRTAAELFGDLGFANHLHPHDEKILDNLRTVQQRSGLPESEELAGLNFTVEMETGTGKTYVYLRTIHELHQQYGFTKFIIVVPSVAIREGVLKNIELTKLHFAEIYGNVPVDSWIYDSKQVSRLRQFATSNQLQILIINIDAFNKTSNNVIYRADDRLSGRMPIEFIQATNPITIIDEPQNMESSRSRESIASLNPLCTLRYSATHRDLYNLVYKLDPVQAYDLKLVKRIEVASVLDEEDFNKPYIYVKSIRPTKTKVSASIEIDVQGNRGPVRKTITVSQNGVDLFDRTSGRANYAGYIVDEINAGWGESPGFVSFSNGVRVYQGQTHGGLTDDIMRVQVEETIRVHLDNELMIHDKFTDDERMKVLSLFFIDRVANYADEEGKIRRWFEEAYSRLAAHPRYEPLNLPSVDEVHNGYFAESRGQAKDTSGKTKADEEAYELIMRDKERLLQLDTPLRFIFSHSALREGWDNPNVFQICTLNESKSDMRKRQEIGRGLRLPVMANGERSTDPNINCLTVVANESYIDFASTLQNEIQEETGVSFGDGRIKNRRERRQIKLRDNWRNTEFQALWERINKKTRYAVRFSTEELIEKASRAIAEMKEIRAPKIRTERAALDVTGEGVSTTVRVMREASPAYDDTPPIPDLLGYLQRQTDLTRSTLAQILIQSGRLGDVATNPQQFMDQAAILIDQELQKLMVDGIKYERIAGAEYEMLLFEEEDVIGYLDSMIDVTKSIYEAVRYDSDVEEHFARDLDLRDDIKLFLKLPPWFKVTTPLGDYNPDWAIVKEQHPGEEKLYLVTETKGTLDQMQLRVSESAKIECGKVHFNTLNVPYKQVTSVADI